MSQDALREILLDDDFHRLSEKLEDQTVFDVLGIRRVEKHHQAILAWLLSPRGNHGLDTWPLETFLRLCLRQGRAEGQWHASEIDGLDLQHADLTTEASVAGTLDEKPWTGRLDLVVEVPIPIEEGLVSAPILALELKLDAEQGADQTARYAQWANEDGRISIETGERTPLLIYLAPKVDSTHLAQGFHFLSLTELSKWLSTLLERTKDLRTQLLINDWQRTLAAREDVENTGELAQLALRLQKRHSKNLSFLQSDTSRETSNALLRHRAVFHLLGVHNRRPGLRDLSPSGAAFIDAIRAGFHKVLNEDWRIGKGAKCLLVDSLLFRRKVEEIVGPKGRGLNLKFWLEHPHQNKARLVLEITGGIQNQSPDSKKELRRKISTSLRPFLSQARHGEMSTGINTILGISFTVDSLETTERSRQTFDAALKAQTIQAQEFALDVDSGVRAWLSEALGKLLRSL